MPSAAVKPAGTATRLKRTLTTIGKRHTSETRMYARVAPTESKENVNAPTGANFAPTPKDAWGDALVKEGASPAAPKGARGRTAASKRAAGKPLEEGLFSPGKVREWDWDHDHVLLDNWNLAFNGSRPLQLSGKVFNNAGPGLEDGDSVEYTSQVVQVEGRIATTKSGTKYYLGNPAPEFEAVRALLCRATAAAELGPAAAAAAASLPFDVESPFNYIDLGPTVACSSVKLPAVAGWTADSNVALLHDWRLVKTAAGYKQCVGTVFNCPGEYDGTPDYQTADVVQMQGRVMRTVDNRLFYLGRREQTDAARGETCVATSAPLLDEAEELGEVEDLLAV